MQPCPLFDTHCHFDFAPFKANTEQHLEQAFAANVGKMVIPAIGPSNWQQIQALSLHYPKTLFFALGFHPYFLSSLVPSKADWDTLEELLSQRMPQCVAIGECGLDGAIEVDMVRQIEVFTRQIQLAQQYQLPLIIHANKAYNEVLRVLKQARFQGKGVMHAFSGSVQQANQFIDMGLYLGVGGVMTYARAKKTRTTFSQVSAQRLVLETDAPDMPICGFQGKVNHPKNLPSILAELARLRQCGESELSEQLWRNSHELFALTQ